MRVGASVTPSIGSTSIASMRVALAQRVERGRRIPVEGKPERRQQRPRRLGDVVGRLALAHGLQEGDHLQQRVDAHLWHRGVPRHPVGASP